MLKELLLMECTGIKSAKIETSDRLWCVWQCECFFYIKLAFLFSI